MSHHCLNQNLKMFHLKYMTYKIHRSTCKCAPSYFELELDETKSTWLKNLDRISRAIFSAATALVSIVLAAFSKAFT